MPPSVIWLVSWLVPGAGHLLQGRAQKGVIFFAAISAMFAIGLWLDGRLFPFAFSEPLVGLAALATRHGLHGHTHLPMAWRAEDGRVRALDPRDHPVLQLDERATLLNPGSVGQPRDGDPRASWALLDTSAQTVAWRRVAYDIPAVQARMSAAGLPAPLISRLAFGH